MAKQSLCNGMTIVPTVQITEIPLKLHTTKMLSYYDRKLGFEVCGVVYLGITV